MSRSVAIFSFYMEHIRETLFFVVVFFVLQVAGHSLWRTYGRQFQKLLHLLCADHFQRIRDVTLDGATGPTSRLEDFLHDAVKRRAIRPPAAQLPPHFL